MLNAATILPFDARAIALPVPTAAPAERGHRLQVARHEPVFLAGDEAAQLFEVVEGAVMLSMILEDGRRQIVDLVFAGGVVGLSETDAYGVTCEALVPSTLRGHWKHDVNRDEALRRLLFRQMERQICRLHDQVLSLGRKTAMEKVATLLVRFCELQGEGTELRGRRLDLPMTRSEMGDYLGLSLETVCRTLTDLQGQGLIEIGRQHGVVFIRQPRRLRQVASLVE